MPWIETLHADAAMLARGCADRLATLTQAALAARGEAWLALAGGRTAPPVFRAWAAHPIDFARVHAVPTDERWVPHAHADCNWRQLGEALAPAVGIDFLPLSPADAKGPPDAAVARERLAARPQDFDAVLVGMGADRHIASLFPGAAGIAAALDPASTVDAVAVVPDPLPAAGPHPRISLSLARLKRTAALLLTITGDDKLAVLRQAQARHDAASPISALLHAPGVKVEIHWSP
jgi:6-phosphogluconolactonase